MPSWARFLKPISSRVRICCRYSFASKPISLEHTVRMRYEGFTSFASGASWKAPLGSEPRKFFARTRVRFWCQPHEFLYSMWTGWLARQNLGRILGPAWARILGFFTLQNLVAKIHVSPGTPHLPGNSASLAFTSAAGLQKSPFAKAGGCF